MKTANYLARVEELLQDIDSDDRQSLLADLREQLMELPEGEVAEILGSPQDFVDEYRRSAGIADLPPRQSVSLRFIASILSLILIPLGSVLLLSMGGGQFIFGPAVALIGWVLARVTPAPIRMAWAVLVGLLGGQILFLILALVFGGLLPLVGVVSLGAVLVLVKMFWDSTANGRPDPSGPRRSVLGATIVGVAATLLMIPILIRGIGAVTVAIAGPLLAIAGVLIHMFLTGPPRAQ